MYTFLEHIALDFVLMIFASMMLIDISGFFRTKTRNSDRKPAAYSPKTLVIIPCKGDDYSLLDNLLSVKKQDYPYYSIICVVDNSIDPALKYIRKAGLKYIISSSDCLNCSGKVRAISTALEKFTDYDVYVIADSDVEMAKGWLSGLVMRLHDKRVGISTSYPYFMHVGGFWSKVKSVWGLVGEGLMESEHTRFGWGGSLAFRKELLSGSTTSFKNSVYSVSDDISLTKISGQKGLKISYVSSSRPVVKTDDNFSKFTEWANRQTALSIIGNRKNLYFGIAFYLSEAILLVSGISLSILVSPIFLLLLVHYARSFAVILKRSRQKGAYLIPISIMMPFLYLYNLLHARGMKSIEWRGSVYRLPVKH